MEEFIDMTDKELSNNETVAAPRNIEEEQKWLIASDTEISNRAKQYTAINDLLTQLTQIVEDGLLSDTEQTVKRYESQLEDLKERIVARQQHLKVSWYCV
jgi:hypothetical protein